MITGCWLTCGDSVQCVWSGLPATFKWVIGLFAGTGPSLPRPCRTMLQAIPGALLVLHSIVHTAATMFSETHISPATASRKK